MSHRPAINPRHLKAFVAAARSGSVVRAADSIHRVQSAITRSIQELEAGLRVRLFERRPHGMLPTEFGRLLLARAERVFDELDAARREIGAPANAPLFTLGIGRQRLLVFVELMKQGHMGAVAEQFGISQPAVSQALREVENGVGQALVTRAPRGIVPNALGERLALHLRRALAELAHAEEEIAARLQGATGHVVVGTLSLGRNWLLPQAIIRATQAHPQLTVATTEGSFEHLATLLRAGEIDFMLGGLRPQAQMAGLLARPVVRSGIAFIARKGHPLCTTLQAEGWPALAHARWVLPNRGTWTRSALEATLSGERLPPAEVAVETADTTITRALLAASDLLTAASPHLFRDELAAGELVALPLDPGSEPRDIGIILRADDAPTVAAGMLMAAVGEVAAL